MCGNPGEPSPRGRGWTLDPPGGMSCFPASGERTHCFFFFAFINLVLIGYNMFLEILQVVDKLSRDWEHDRAGPMEFPGLTSCSRGLRMCPRFQSPL